MLFGTGSHKTSAPSPGTPETITHQLSYTEPFSCVFKFQ